MLESFDGDIVAKADPSRRQREVGRVKRHLARCAFLRRFPLRSPLVHQELIAAHLSYVLLAERNQFVQKASSYCDRELPGLDRLQANQRAGERRAGRLLETCSQK